MKEVKTILVPCTCPCHNPGVNMMHIAACCRNGFIETFKKESENE